MSIAIPVASASSGAPFEGRLAHAAGFVLYDATTGASSLLCRTPFAGSCGGLAAFLAEAGADAVCIDSAGYRYMETLAAAGVSVYRPRDPDCSSIIRQYRTGELTPVPFLMPQLGETLLGRPYVSVSLAESEGPCECRDTFCAHVWHTMMDGRHRLVCASSVRCAGALYALGLDPSPELATRLGAELFREGRSTTLGSAVNMVRALRRIPSCTALSLARGGTGDVCVAYLSPHLVMRLVQAYHRLLDETPDFLCSSLAPVCGVATAQTHVTGRLSLSFGCTDSRRFGGIGDNEIVVGIPGHLLEPLRGALSALHADEEG